MKIAKNWQSRHCCTTLNWPSKIDYLNVLQKKDVMYIKHIWYWKDFIKIDAWSVTKPRDCFWITDSFLAHNKHLQNKKAIKSYKWLSKTIFPSSENHKGAEFSSNQWIRLKQPRGIKIFPINWLYLFPKNKRPLDISWSINVICFEWHSYQLIPDKLIHFISLSLSRKASSSSSSFIIALTIPN